MEPKKSIEVLAAAEQLLESKPDWITFYREILGLTGVARQICNTPEYLKQFYDSVEYMQIQTMLAKLRADGPVVYRGQEATRVITVRLPACMHEVLQAEAHEHATTMNQLCISKLASALAPNVAAVQARHVSKTKPQNGRQLAGATG